MSDKKELQSETIDPKSAETAAKNAKVESAPEKAKKGNEKAPSPAKPNPNKAEENKAVDKAKTETPAAQAKAVENKAAEPKVAEKAVKTEQVIVKKGGGTGIALLALLVALGVGGAGYYFGQLEVDKINQKVTALEKKVSETATGFELKLANVASNVANNATSTAATLPAPMPKATESTQMPNFEQERAQLSQLLAAMQASDNKLSALEHSLAEKEKAYTALQAQINKVASSANAQPSDWLLNEADFLLTNALRKLVLDNDVDTSVSLLKVADEVLEKVSLPQVKAVRSAINQDLKQLLSVNSVDQNAIMQSLSQLANNVDELVVLNVNFGDEGKKDDKVSDDPNDWQQNLEKSANSFLNKFIRITPRSENSNLALLAPNQDIYLRENIRLRLQIAILAVPRQQNELYKQSLETVASWVRSYFDTNSETAVNFLKALDELAEQSIYIEVPNQLNSLNALDKLLNKAPEEVQKIEISADKALTEANQAAAQEIKQAEEKAAENAEPAQPAAQ